jgi:GT2 family glycosyltransferase
MNAELLYSIIIVNYQGEKHLKACLTSVQQQTFPAHQFEVLIVDNASTDGSLAILRNEFPQYHPIRSAVNLGFAGGNNLGVKYARASWVVLLNNDTLADPFWLEEMHRVRLETGQAVAAKLVLASDPTILNSAGLFLLRDGRGADRGYLQPDLGQYERTEPVFAGCGAAVMLPKPAPGEELLPSDYFLYYEDLAAGWARQSANLGMVYAPRALVRHAVGAASREASPRFQFFIARNRLFTALRQGDMVLVILATMTILVKCLLAGFEFLQSPTREHLNLLIAFCHAIPSALWAQVKYLIQREVLR